MAMPGTACSNRSGLAISLGEDVTGGVLAMGESEIFPNMGDSGPCNGGDLSSSSLCREISAGPLGVVDGRGGGWGGSGSELIVHWV